MDMGTSPTRGGNRFWKNYSIRIGPAGRRESYQRSVASQPVRT